MRFVTEPVFLTAAVLLCASGVSKLRKPSSLGAALRVLRLPSGQWAVRLIGLTEAVAGSICLIAPSSASVDTLAVLYLVFSSYLAYVLLRRIPLPSCGCVGARELPPSWLHAALNLAAGLCALSLTRDPPYGLLQMADASALTALFVVTGTIGVGYAVILAISELPAALSRTKNSFGHSPRNSRTRPTPGSQIVPLEIVSRRVAGKGDEM